MRAEDQIFWDRLVEMPYVEAIDELQRRRAHLVEERAEAEIDRGTFRWDARADQARATQFTRINAELKRMNQLQNDLSFKRAVIAIFGLEGYEQCKVWIASRDPLAGGM